MENMMEYVKPELLVLIPVLYMIGMGCKQAAAVRDEYIPAILGLLGVGLVVLWLLGSTLAADAQGWALLAWTGIVQGVLCAGAAVYFDQIGKQHNKLNQ